jgi:broad specificity phosphatase PhoE
MESINKLVILSRLGETEYNIVWKISGAGSDSPLTERGKKEAQLLGERLKDEGYKIDAIYTSALNRTIETGRIVARCLGFDEERIKKVKEFNEPDFGDWEEKTMKWIKENYPEEYEQFMNPKDINWRFPKGESWKEAILRSLPYLLEIKEKISLIIGHGLINRIILSVLSQFPNIEVLSKMLENLKKNNCSDEELNLLNKSISKMMNISQLNVCINLINFYDNGQIEIPVINDTKHLEVK